MIIYIIYNILYHITFTMFYMLYIIYYIYTKREKEIAIYKIHGNKHLNYTRSTHKENSNIILNVVIKS